MEPPPNLTGNFRTKYTTKKKEIRTIWKSAADDASSTATGRLYGYRTTGTFFSPPCRRLSTSPPVAPRCKARSTCGGTGHRHKDTKHTKQAQRQMQTQTRCNRAKDNHVPEVGTRPSSGWVMHAQQHLCFLCGVEAESASVKGCLGNAHSFALPDALPDAARYTPVRFMQLRSYSGQMAHKAWATSLNSPISRSVTKIDRRSSIMTHEYVVNPQS